MCSGRWRMEWTVSGSAASLHSEWRAGNSRIEWSRNSGSARGERRRAGLSRDSPFKAAFMFFYLCVFCKDIWTFKMQCILFSFSLFLKRIYTCKLLSSPWWNKVYFYQISNLLCQFCMDYKEQNQNTFHVKWLSFFIFLKYCFMLTWNTLLHTTLYTFIYCNSSNGF